MCKHNINVYPLLKSKIFLHKIDFDSWPVLHSNCEEIQKPYNGSLFALRHSYSSIFSENQFEVSTKDDGQRLYKISYTANLLPQYFSSNHANGSESLLETFRDGSMTNGESDAPGANKLDYFASAPVT